MIVAGTAWVVLILAISSVMLVAYGNRRVKSLKDIQPSSPEQLPFLSVVIAARNEEKKIAAGLGSILASDYPSFEVVVVNDRSDDGTGSVVDAIALKDSRVGVMHLVDLEKGWLGKNHALHRGALQAKGEYVLFTDADVIFKQDTLKKAMAYVVDQKLDHFTVIPEVYSEGYLLPLMLSYFTFSFAAFFQPWKMRDPDSRYYAGIGAFNLVKKEVYSRLGGHEKIKLRPDDDLKLGKLFKLGKHRQDIMFGLDQVSVEWYETFWQLFRGLEKNAFAGADYRLSVYALMVVLTVTFHVLPFVYMLVGFKLYAWAVFFASSWILVLGSLDNNRFHKLPPWSAPFFPLSACLMLVVVGNSVFKTLCRRGIYWRGTFYPLHELRSNKV